MARHDESICVVVGVDDVAGLGRRRHRPHHLFGDVADSRGGDRHDLDSLGAVCDRIAALVDKRALVGTLDELRKLDHPWLQAYFHGPRGRAALSEARAHGA